MAPIETPKGASQDKNIQGETKANNPFVDLETLGLRRGTITRKKQNRRIPTILTLAVTLFASPLELTTQTVSHAYHSRVVEYDYHLKSDFDGTKISTSPLAHVYISSQENNETCTL